jgi:hypothetical protein
MAIPEETMRAVVADIYRDGHAPDIHIEGYGTPQ